MDLPNKRLKTSEPGQDFVSLSGGDNAESDVAKYGYGNPNGTGHPSGAPRGPRSAFQQHDRRVLQDRRHQKDRPKSKHVLPGHDDWWLVRTKFGRRFVHNVTSKQSFWRIPSNLIQAIEDFELNEGSEQEKAQNAKWAEEQLKQIEEQSKAAKASQAVSRGDRGRRRRSESLQREDEEAFMAELAAEAARAEEARAEAEVAPVLESEADPNAPKAGDTGYDSEGSFEYVEVTDSEGEGEDGDGERIERREDDTREGDDQADQEEDEQPVEFGEDDIAYQLAAMGEEYGLDPGEYGDDAEEEWEDGAEGLHLSSEDAANLFKDLLDDHGISPFTPWDKVIADESPDSILNDARYTVLPNMKARKEVWDVWAKHKAAVIKEERARMEKLDPRIPYLAFLADKATPKLYWPEFKRKYKRDAELNDRKLSDKDREKLYRDHVSRLKLPESTRKADLQILLKSLPLRELNRDTALDSLPHALLTHLHFVSLPQKTRDHVLLSHTRTLAHYSPDGDNTYEDDFETTKKKQDKLKRQAAFEARERAVAEEKRKAERDERIAKRDLREEEDELRRAMAVGRR